MMVMVVVVMLMPAAAVMVMMSMHIAKFFLVHIGNGMVAADFKYRADLIYNQRFLFLRYAGINRLHQPLNGFLRSIFRRQRTQQILHEDLPRLYRQGVQTVPYFGQKSLN